MKRLVFLALTGCPTAQTLEAPLPIDDNIQAAGLVVGLPVDPQRMEGDASYTIEALEASVLDIQLLAEAEQRPVVDAMSLLVTNCPYTRAKVMVMLTLDDSLSSMDTTLLSPAGQERFAQLIRGVKAQSEFFRATVGHTLPAPLSMDYLASAVQTVDGPTFAASEDPVALSLHAIEQIDDAVEAMPAPTQQSIQAAWATIEPHLGNNVVLHFNERFAHEHLRALVKTESADDLPEGLAELVPLMDELMSRGC